jgi:hypothetical protein
LTLDGKAEIKLFLDRAEHEMASKRQMSFPTKQSAGAGVGSAFGVKANPGREAKSESTVKPSKKVLINRGIMEMLHVSQHNAAEKVPFARIDEKAKVFFSVQGKAS